MSESTDYYMVRDKAADYINRNFFMSNIYEKCSIALSSIINGNPKCCNDLSIDEIVERVIRQVKRNYCLYMTIKPSSEITTIKEGKNEY